FDEGIQAQRTWNAAHAEALAIINITKSPRERAAAELWKKNLELDRNMYAYAKEKNWEELHGLRFEYKRKSAFIREDSESNHIDADDFDYQGAAMEDCSVMMPRKNDVGDEEEDSSDFGTDGISYDGARTTY